MQIFDATIMKYREQTEADIRWGKTVIKDAFPELNP